MPKQGQFIFHDFYCINCGNKSYTLPRKTSKLKEQFPDILCDNIDNCENNEELREFLLKNNIKYIEYDNVVETEGTSFVILDESELNNIEEYTFYEFLTMHYDKI